MALTATPKTATAPLTARPTLPRSHTLLHAVTRARRSDAVLATVIGGVAAASSFAFSWNPSFWGDEAASVMSAQRPLPSLFSMLGNVDAVHGAYYLFVHFWIRAFGISELAVRAPSALAVGVAAAGIVVLALRLSDRRTAVLAGLACAVLPRFTHMGAEARSYAFSAAIAVWLTVVLVRLLTSRKTRWPAWAVYAVLLAAGTYVFLYSVLLVIAHGIFIAAVRPGRNLVRRWAAATGAGILLALPIAVASISERSQLAFLANRHAVTAHRVLVTQWFGTTNLAIVCWALILVALAVAVRHPGRPSSRLALLAALWLIVPTGLLLVANATVAPLYQGRYASFAAPAAAILVALGVQGLVSRRVQLVAAALVIALALPTWVAQRGEFAKDRGSDWRQASAFIHDHASPGDGIYFDPSTKPSRRPRLALHVYPGDYAGLVDVAVKTPFDEHPGLWDIALPLADASAAISTVDRLWVVDLHGSTADTSTEQAAILRADGFRLTDSTRLHRTTIYEYTR